MMSLDDPIIITAYLIDCSGNQSGIIHLYLLSSKKKVVPPNGETTFFNLY